MIEKLRIHITQIFTALLFLIILFTNNAWEANAPLVTQILFLFGAILVGIATMGRLWCSVYIAGYKTEKLITEGPYSVTRNPLYFFSFIGSLGLGLATETMLIPLLIVISFAIYYPKVIKSEEAEMAQLHGQDFARYISNVPAFFPKISILKEPDVYSTKPIVFRKHIFSALWFVWLMGILELIEGLHEINILPMFFSIY